MPHAPDPATPPAEPLEPAELTVEYRGFAIHYHLDSEDDPASRAVGGVEPLSDEAWEAWGQLGGSREVTLSGKGEARRAHFFALAKLAIDEALDPPDA